MKRVDILVVACVVVAVICQSAATQQQHNNGPNVGLRYWRRLVQPRQRLAYMPVTHPPAPIVPINTKKQVCGRPRIPLGLIFGGNMTEKGAWPWIAPLFYRNEFICGSTLISNKHVITAAHCVIHTVTSKQLKTEGFRVDLGKFDLNESDEGDLQIRKVRKTIVHENFNHTSLRNDIAILLLDKDVQYTLYVIPICLWSMDTTLDYIVDTKATVVGWGVTEARRVSNKPLLAQVPIVSQEVCHGSHEAFKANVDPDRSLCAGSRMGVGPCQGDSGSGLFLQDKDRNGRLRWFLRGIVSFNAPGNKAVCHLDGYSLFTDVAKYTLWINEEIQLS